MATTPAKKAAAKKTAEPKLENEPKTEKPRIKKNEDKVNENTVEKDFVFVHEADPNRQLPGGVYLDQVQREEAEIARAKAEGREPDLDNPPAAAGTPLVSREQFLNAGGSYYPNAHDLPAVKQNVPAPKD